MNEYHEEEQTQTRDSSASGANLPDSKVEDAQAESIAAIGEEPPTKRLRIGI